MMLDVLVTVRRQPSNYKTAKYLLSSIEDLSWDMVSGGVKTTMFNQYFIYGYVMCDAAVEGEVEHSGEYGIENHGPCPHRIKVCALKKDNKDIFKTLLEIVGPKPQPLPSFFRMSKSAIYNAKWSYTYKEIILSFLTRERKPGSENSESNLIEYMWKNKNHFHKDINISAIRGTLTTLVREGRIICDVDPKDRRNNIYRIKPG